MQNLNYIVYSIITLFFFSSHGHSVSNAEMNKIVSTFSKTYCVKCHGPDKQKADLRMDQLMWDPSDKENLNTWKLVIDSLEFSEMPPKKSRQPTKLTKQKYLTLLNKAFFEATQNQDHDNGVVLRRLNRSQYVNTVSELLDIDNTILKVESLLPKDSLVEGFDTIGEHLVMSDFLLVSYLKAARALLDYATYPESKPASSTYRMDKDFRMAKGGEMKMGRGSKFQSPNAKDFLLFQNSFGGFGDTRGQIFKVNDGAEQKGWFEFEFEVESRGRGKVALVEKPKTKVETTSSSSKKKKKPAKPTKAPKEPKSYSYEEGDLHRLEIYLVDTTSQRDSVRRLIEKIDLPDNKRVTLKRKIWLDKNWTVALGFANTNADGANDYAYKIGAFQKLSKNMSAEAKKQAKKDMDRMVYDHIASGKSDPPRIIVHNYIEEGPVFEQWPPISHQTVYGKPKQSMESVIKNFAEKAFRRSVTSSELKPYFDLAKKSPEGARSALEAILCSPQFLYLDETEGKLDDLALANRLAYFLWDGMPDDQLYKLAQSKQLTKGNSLDTQIERMLYDEKSDNFTRKFTWSWLKLQSTLEMQPDLKKYKIYHRNRIAEAMVEETNYFFKHLIENNLPISNFLDSDFTFINSDLGRIYDIKGVNTTTQFQMVSLKPSDRRGGLLGQASVLTASADGVETSPVTRGIWILENILGTPPPPPPENVETLLNPNVNDGTTVKEMLAQHRQEENCYQCHKKIDPVGFSLEGFNAIGMFRDKYDSELPVDTTGVMPSGDKFKGAESMKQILLKDIDLFRKNLIKKLLMYGVGREIEGIDSVEINRIAEAAMKEGDGVKDLIKQVIHSKIFTHK